MYRYGRVGEKNVVTLKETNSNEESPASCMQEQASICVTDILLFLATAIVARNDHETT